MAKSFSSRFLRRFGDRSRSADTPHPNNPTALTTVFSTFNLTGKQYSNPKPGVIHHARIHILSFDTSADTKELKEGIRIGQSVSATVNEQIISHVQKYRDCFCKKGTYRPILGYEFTLDTGTSKPAVCCRKPQYGPNESTIIMDQVDTLLKNDWIELCEGPWGSSIVLALKPHQEDISDIDKFIWCMCVSYWKLNSVTKQFQYPIPRCKCYHIPWTWLQQNLLHQPGRTARLSSSRGPPN